MKNGSAIIRNIKNDPRTFDYAAGVCYHYGKAKERRLV